MRVVFADDFLGVVERSGGGRMSGRAYEDFASTTSGTVWHEILLVFIEFDTCFLAEALEHMPSCVGRYRRGFNVVLNADLDQRAVGAPLFGFRVGISTSIQHVGHSLREVGR